MQTPNRYLLRYQGSSAMPADDLQCIQSRVDVLNTSRKMLLVEAEPEALTNLLKELPEWTAKPEIIHKMPLSQPSIKNRL